MKTDENGNLIVEDDTTATTESETAAKAESNEAGERNVSVTLSDTQFAQMFGGAVEAAKRSTKNQKETIATKHDVPSVRKTVSRGIRQDDTSSATAKRAHEDKILATYFGGLANRKVGNPMVGDEMLKRASEMENEYLQRDTRAMTVGTDSTGGYLAPELFETRVIEQLERFGVARRNATIINMTTEVMHLPNLTADVTAYDVAEAVAITTSQPTFGQVTLQPRKQAVMAGPLSDELFINANPAIVPLLIDSSARALAKLEDNHVFVGASASFTGLLESTTNEVAQATGTSSSAIVVDDIISMMNILDDHLLTDDAKFYWNKAITGYLMKDKGNDNYYWTDPRSGAPRQLLGYDVAHISQMPNVSATADTNYGVFGDLKNVYLGIRGGLRVDLLTEGTVNSINLGEKASYAVRVIEYFDAQSVNDEAFAIIKTAAA